MKLVHILFIFLLVNVMKVEAQDRSIAYVITKSHGGLAWQAVNNHVISELNKTYSYDLYFYNYNVNKELTYAPALNGNKEEKAARYLRTFYIDIAENYSPELNVTLDTNKNVTGVFFLLNNGSIVQSKTTDLATSHIVQNSREILRMTEETFLDFKSRINIADWKTIFGGNPNNVKAKDPKRYNLLVEKLYDKHRDYITNYHKQKAEIIATNLVNEQLELLNNELPVVQNVQMEKDKINRFVITPEKLGAKYVAAYTSVFTLDTFNNFIYSTQKGLFVGNTEKNGTIVFGKAPFRSSKEAAEALNAGRKLYYSIRSQGYGDKLKESSNPIHLAINTNDADVNISLERYFNKLKDVKLIDVSNQELIKAFRNKYKSEQFIDYSLEVKDLGVTHLLTSLDNKAQITNVENGNVVGAFDIDSRYPVIYNALMDALKMNIEVINISKEKKGKAEELILFAPLGFTNIDKLDVFVVDVEKVNGKDLERRTKIGELKSTNEEFDDAKGRSERREVKDGHKEIYDAFKSGKKIVIRLSEKVGLMGKLSNVNNSLGKLNLGK